MRKLLQVKIYSILYLCLGQLGRLQMVWFLITQTFTETCDTEDCNPQNDWEAHTLGGESWHHSPDTAGFGPCTFQPPCTCAAWKAKRRDERTWTIHCYSPLRGSWENFSLESRRIKAYTPGMPQTDHSSPEPGVQPGENATLHQSGNWPTWPLQPMLRSQCNLHSSGKSALFPSPNLAIGSSSSSQRPHFSGLHSTHQMV